VTSLYEKLGEEAAISKVVAGFYERVLADESLAPFFDGIDMAALRRHQAAFLSAATGGPKAYTGPDLASAHAGRGIKDEHFDGVVGHLVAELTDLGVMPDVIDETVAALAPLRGTVVGAAT
jgi:hemoglobin